MPLNAGYEFANAEKKLNAAQTDDEKVIALEEMLRYSPDHKSSQKYRGELKTKIKKLKDKVVTERKRKKSLGTKISIKKGDMQAALVGLTNSGKSSLLKALTNAEPKIESYCFTTQVPEPGILYSNTCPIQVIDIPAIGADSFDTGIINISDTALIVVEKITEIPDVEKVLDKFNGKRIIVYNKIDLSDDNTKRKIEQTLKTKKYNFVLTSCKTGEGIEDLKEKIFKSFDKIRVYTKQPGKPADPDPVILKPHTIVSEIARIIFRGKLEVIKKIRIWGPSSKFGGQEVGMKHELKDHDIVEFATR